MTTIDVILSCYNGGMTIGRAVASAKRQGAGVIVIDGGSSDDTVYEAKTAGAYVEVVPGSQVVGLNAAIDRSKADYLIQLDADDWLEPGGLKALREAMDSGAGFAYGCTKYWGLESRLHVPRPFNPSDFYKEFLSLYAFMWRRDTGLRYADYLNETRGNLNAADWGLALQLIEAGQAGQMVPALVLNHVRRLASTSAAAYLNSDTIIEKMRERHPQLQAVAI